MSLLHKAFKFNRNWRSNVKKYYWKKSVIELETLNKKNNKDKTDQTDYNKKRQTYLTYSMRKKVFCHKFFAQKALAIF